MKNNKATSDDLTSLYRELDREPRKNHAELEELAAILAARNPGFAMVGGKLMYFYQDRGTLSTPVVSKGFDDFNKCEIRRRK